MVEQQPVQNLQDENHIHVTEHESISSTVFEQRQNWTSTVESRIPLPISTVQSLASQIGGSRTFLPRCGYEMLDEMPSVHIEQSYENLSTVNTENRFIVRSAFGEALFAATESSTNRDRLIWGNARPFQMHVLDKTHQEALTFRRKYALGIPYCQYRCLEIWAPPGDFLGEIVEVSSFCNSDYEIRKENGEVAFKIKGQANTGCGCCLPSEGYFEVVTPDLQTSKGSISRKWSSNLSQYTMNIYFTDVHMDAKSKSLFLGAGFFLAYLCF